MANVRIQADEDIRRELNLHDSVDSNDVERVMQQANQGGKFKAEKSPDGNTVTIRRK